ncbi:MAG: tetratricopeptide repeat protein [Candidatus Methylacidiphilales bacterium]
MSSESFYESSLARGLVLKEQGRYAEAENYFRRALSADPDNSEALNFLAGCQLQQGRSGEALSTITDAIAREPNEADYHALQAIILSVLDRPKDATAAAMRGLALEPTSLFALNALTQTYLSQKRWALAEESARKALSLDADDSLAANFLALSLRMQNKWDENAEQIRGLLSRDPEDAFTHSNAGWAALSRGDSAAAETHFRESLRLDPDNDTAREGLLQSFKGRSWIYRRYLDYCFFMEKYSGTTQLLIVVGLLVGAKVLGAILTGPYKPLGFAVLLAYTAFVLFSHVARVVGNVFLLMDRFARYVLRPEEKLEAMAVGTVLALGCMLGITGILAPSGGQIFLAGILIGGSSIPLCQVFTNTARVGSVVFGCIAAYVVFVAVVCVLHGVFGAFGTSESTEEILVLMGGTALLALVGSTWLTNVPFLRR